MERLKLEAFERQFLLNKTIWYFGRLTGH